MIETANIVTYADLWQVLGIFSGIWFAFLSLITSLAVAWYIRDSNRRDKENDRRHSEVDRRFQEMEESNERRHQELLKAIGLLYHHVHADGSPAIVPLPDIDPVAPAPADN